MIRALAETWVALNGVAKALSFKPGWQAHFDVSLAGMWRSFFAALIALPAALFVFQAANATNVAMPLAEFLVRYAITWPLFPLAAAVTVRLLGVPQNFTPWLILHNWTVVILWGFVMLIWALNLAGIGGRDLFGLLAYLYIFVRILVHWRVAYLTLGLPTITSAFAAAVPMLVQAIAVTLVSNLFEAGQTPPV